MSSRHARVTACVRDALVQTLDEPGPLRWRTLRAIGFEAGRISQLELRGTRAALITARNAAVDARLARVRAEIDLARLQARAPFGGVQ